MNVSSRVGKKNRRERKSLTKVRFFQAVIKVTENPSKLGNESTATNGWSDRWSRVQVDVS